MINDDVPICSGLGEIQLEMDHIPSKEEIHEAKKQQLREIFGKEEFEKMFKEAKSFFRDIR